jgi:putative aminopeptidase FrvX
VFKDASSASRELDNMHVRIDEIVKSKDDVLKLGIQNGDYIAIDTKTTITESGFIKSRFIDDKMSIAILFGLLKTIKDENIIPAHNITIIVSTYEEVGHGCSYIPDNIDEFIAVDMGCIGLDLSCSEYDVSICAKDSSGPYDYEITSRFIELAKQHNLQYAVDIYPMYGSDVSAALRGGSNIKGGLIGPGVSASHGMERTHIQAVENTLKLLKAYIL